MLGGNYGGGDSSFVYSADGPKAVAAAIYVDIFDNNSGGGGKRGDGGFCLVGHFTFYKLQKEVYVNRLPRVLRGSWHTYVGLELQLILSFAMALLEAFITVRWFDFPALAALVLAVAETVAAFLVRDITFKAYKGLASEGENAAGAPPKPGKKADDGGDAGSSSKDGNGAKGNRADDEVEDFFDNKE